MNIWMGNLFQNFNAAVYKNYCNNNPKFIYGYLYLFLLFSLTYIFIAIGKWTFSISDIYLLVYVIIFH